MLRTAIFIGYLAAISRLPDLRRVFQYHGAEHKTISCFEAGDELTPASAKRVLAPASPLRDELPADRDGAGDLRLRADRAARLVLAGRSRGSSGIPLIAGLSYEVIKWAGKHRNKRWVRALMWPGLMLQNLTTREPDDDQLEVAIRALKAVLAVEDPYEAKRDQAIEIVA